MPETDGAAIIRDVLKQLREISLSLTETDEYRGNVAELLTEKGYEGCENVDEVDADQVRNVLAQAVKSSVEKCVDFQDDNNATVEQQLNVLLKWPRSKPNRAPTSYLEKEFAQINLSQLKSPLDIAKPALVGIKNDALQAFVKSLIEHQFQIRWATIDGEPKNFNYYKFCNVENFPTNATNEMEEGKTKHLNFIPRNAHVKVQLYRYCRVWPKRREYSKEQLCPPVYIRKQGGGWWKWNPVRNNFHEKSDEHFAWIDHNIRDHIFQNAHVLQDPNNFEELTPVLGKPAQPTLYWAVLQDTDFQSGGHLRLNEIGKTQVYVGKAEKGIKDRWLADSRSHCKKMKKCLDIIQEMDTYAPNCLKDIQLVDARLLLAKLRRESESLESKREKCALFVMKIYGGDAEQDLATDEKRNIDGKKYAGQQGDQNILSPDVCRYWKPKYMAYGMNCMS